jgi:hypothetical protein
VPLAQPSPLQMHPAGQQQQAQHKRETRHSAQSWMIADLLHVMRLRRPITCDEVKETYYMLWGLGVSVRKRGMQRRHVRCLQPPKPPPALLLPQLPSAVQ